MIWLLFVSFTFAEGIEITPPPAIGTEVTIRVTDARNRPAIGLTVRVHHRPGLDGEQELAVGISDSRGQVRWVPAFGGVADIRAKDYTKRVQIPWAGPPSGPATLLALLFAGALGAIGFGLSRSGVRGSPAQRKQ